MEDLKLYTIDGKKPPISEDDVYQIMTSYLYAGNNRISPNGSSFKNITIGQQTVVVPPDDVGRLQSAYNLLDQRGGGIIQLLSGTYNITTAILGKSSVSLRGIAPSTTILDFNDTSANLSFSGTDVYTTGTITAIASSVLVTGSGTLWLANVEAGQHLFLGTRWYKIAAVTSDTTLTLAEGYTDNVTLPSTYRIASIMQDVKFFDLAFQDSTGTNLAITDGRQIAFDNVHSNSANKGVVFTNCSEVSAERVLAVTNTSHGIEAVNMGLSDWESVNSISNGGSGLVLNNMKTFSLFSSSFNANTADGINITTGSEAKIFAQTSGNGGQGIELVSGCDSITIEPIARDNTSDGIKLTATSDNCKILAGYITDNGGYGINIAAATCDSNLIDQNNLSTNTSGNLNDSGTGTIIGTNAGI